MRLEDKSEEQFEMLILTLGGSTAVRRKSSLQDSHLVSGENSWVQSHCPADVNKSNQQPHGHSKGSIPAIFLTKRIQFFLWETNKSFACECSLYCSYISFQNCLKSTMLPWTLATLLGSVCKATHYQMYWIGSELGNSHPVNLSSCAWEYFSARPVPVWKSPCCRIPLRTE